MSGKVYADVVAVITSSSGYRKYRKVGAMLQMDNNNASKGPGFMIMLDRHLNPAGVGTDASVVLSTYWPKEEAKPDPARHQLAVRKQPTDTDDDGPF